MSDTEERLSKLEARLEKVETTVKWAEEKLTAVAKSPQTSKILKMFGVDLS